MIRTSNTILKNLNHSDIALIEPKLERVSLLRRQALFESLEPIRFVHFFESGLSSEVSVSARSAQIGCVGREGCSGVSVLLGIDRAPYRAFMQAGGTALRITASDLASAMDTSSTLRNALLNYAHVYMVQIASTAMSNGRYEVEQRLARWILMGHDRLGDELPFTHDFFAVMLGVRRPTVTDALHKLEGRLAIKSARGLCIVRDRAALEEIAGDCYGAPEAEYRRVFGES